MGLLPFRQILYHLSYQGSSDHVTLTIQCIQFSSVTQSCPTLWDPINWRKPGLPVHHQLLELAQTHVHHGVMRSNHLMLCRSILLLPSIFPSISVFSIVSVLHIKVLEWPKCWSFSFSINPSNEYSGLISFGMDWLDLLAVQGTLKSLQHHNLKASSVLSFLYSPTLTSTHDYWKKYRFN